MSDGCEVSNGERASALGGARDLVAVSVGSLLSSNPLPRDTASLAFLVLASGRSFRGWFGVCEDGSFGNDRMAVGISWELDLNSGLNPHSSGNSAETGLVSFVCSTLASV